MKAFVRVRLSSSLCVDLCQRLGGVSCPVMCYQRRSVPAAEKGREPESGGLGETGRWSRCTAAGLVPKSQS